MYASTFAEAFLQLRAWLHGEFQPGLKFRSAHRAETLLWLRAQFQPGRKTQISVRKFTEVRKHSQCACSRSFFGPGWNSVSITWDFSRFSGPFGRAENPSWNLSYLEKLLKLKTVQLVTIKVDDYVTREFTWNDLWISTRVRLNNIFLLRFDCKSRSQRQQVARPGDQEYIFDRPRPNVSRLRQPDAVRAQPWANILSRQGLV